MKIINKKVSDLKEFENNSNTHPQHQIRKLIRSIEEFGFNVPILIDKDGTVISGHARLIAAKEAGLKTVPTICLSHLSDAQKRAFIIADNRIAQDSAFDMDILSQEYDALLKESEDLIGAIGFETIDIQNIENILSLDEDEEEGDGGDQSSLAPEKKSPNKSTPSEKKSDVGEANNKETSSKCPECGHEF